MTEIHDWRCFTRITAEKGSGFLEPQHSSIWNDPEMLPSRQTAFEHKNLSTYVSASKNNRLLLYQFQFPLSHWHEYSQRVFMANNWCLHLPLCVHTGVSESTRRNHSRECSCTLALSTILTNYLTQFWSHIHLGRSLKVKHVTVLRWIKFILIWRIFIVLQLSELQYLSRTIILHFLPTHLKT